MGLIREAIWGLGIFFVGALLNPCFSNSDTILETRPWPAKRSCEACVPIQFGNLEMRLAPSEIGKILVVGGGDSVLHIFPEIDNPRSGVHFLAISHDRLVGAYKRSGLLTKLGITTNEQFFDALGRRPIDNKSLANLRRIEQIDAADSYTKTSKESIHVYWIKSSASGGGQRIYFVVGREEMVYLLAGDVTQEFYEAVLSNLRIVKVP